MLKFYYHKILINSYEFVRFTHSSHNLYNHQPHSCKQVRLPIISIKGKNLSALDVGKTNIKITASLNYVTTETNMTVEITNESFILQLTPSQNCYFDDNILYLTGDFCRFTVNIIDYDGNLIEDFYYLSTGPSTLNKEFLYFELQSTQDCQIIFYIPAENTLLKLNVVHL